MTTCVVCERVLFVQKLVMAVMAVVTVLWQGAHGTPLHPSGLGVQLPLSTADLATRQTSTRSYSPDPDIPRQH